MVGIGILNEKSTVDNKMITRLGVDRVKPWNSVRINIGRHLIIKGHRRS